MTREEIRDEIWDALMNRMDIDVSTTDLADAALERLESLGLIAIADTHPKDGDVEQAPLVSGGGAGTAIAQKEAPPSPSDRIEQLNQGGSK